MNSNFLAEKQEPEGFYEQLKSIDLLVVNNARYFSIDESKFDLFLEKLPRLPETNLLNEREHLFDSTNTERTLNYFFALESVNFGGGFSSELRTEGFHEGSLDLYQTVSLRLKKWFEGNGSLPAKSMAGISLQQVHEIFGFDCRKPTSSAIAAMFRESLQETGNFTLRHFNGSFTAFLDSAERSVERLVSTLWQLPKFRDIHPYTLSNGKEFNVVILKRAQHIAGSLSLAMERIGQGTPFDDLDKLTAFPDNRLSHALMVDGLLVPSPTARQIIERGETVPVGSAIEVENRICGRHIVRLLSRRSSIMQVRLDHWIWENSFIASLLTDAGYDAVPQLKTKTISFNY